MTFQISGIQQIGIGVPDLHHAWKWYREAFGIDVRMFEERAEAALMTGYTGNEIHTRHAALALHMGGGGGLEIWQFTSRTPQPSLFTPQFGDTGIFVLKIKSADVSKLHAHHQRAGLKNIGPITKRPNGDLHYYLQDPHGFLFEVVPSDEWFQHSAFGGGVGGAAIGVSDIDRALPLYSELLGYDRVILDTSRKQPDWEELPGGTESYRRVILKRSQPALGPFSELLGSGELELVQCLDRSPQKIYANRYWGDLGYIHICFDVQDMVALSVACAEKGFPFTVDSGTSSFDMGDASGRFSYIEDPDGTLIEFVETHRIPILKKWGWHLDLSRRDPKKPLSKWMLKLLGINRVK